MKTIKPIKIVTFIFVVFTFLSCKNDSISKELPVTLIEIKNPVFNFGKIEKKIETITRFNFTNKGDAPLVLLDVKTSCGCTVPTWTEGNIAKGKDGFIEITYDAKYSGPFRKTISVFYNGENSPVVLTIRGEVVE